MNPHRNNFVSGLGEKDFRCIECGRKANTMTAKQTHADLFEPRRLDTRYLMEDK